MPSRLTWTRKGTRRQLRYFAVAAVMRKFAARLGNMPAVARASYVSPAVVEHYLDARTIEDFRPRHLRVVTARDISSIKRSWRRFRCCVRGEYGRTVKPPRIHGAISPGRSDLGQEDSARLRQLREGSRRGKGSRAPRHVHRRAARRQAGRSLRRLRGEDAGRAGRQTRQASESSHRLNSTL